MASDCSSRTRKRLTANGNSFGESNVIELAETQRNRGEPNFKAKSHRKRWLFFVDPNRLPRFEPGLSQGFLERGAVEQEIQQGHQWYGHNPAKGNL